MSACEIKLYMTIKFNSIHDKHFGTIYNNLSKQLKAAAILDFH